MAWFRKKPDLISDRERALSDEIAQLEVQIKELDGQMQRNHSQPRLASTALPHGASVAHAASAPSAGTSAPVVHEPYFEETQRDWSKAQEETSTAPEHFNDLGMRKYDFPALLRRIRDQFRGPSTTNPKLVSYLAAGGIQGLRPLRYEKRVARNRFIVFVGFLVLVLVGILLFFVRHQR